jgi:hypothetical protein
LRIVVDRDDNAGHKSIVGLCPNCQQKSVFVPLSNDILINRDSISVGFRKCPDPHCSQFIMVIEQGGKL